jgi:hypothetical protein
MDLLTDRVQSLKVLTARTEARVLIALAKTQHFLLLFRQRAGPFAFSVASLLALLAYRRPFQDAVLRLSDPRDLQLAVGALIGTVLTLGYSLSIIPVQRAAEVYTPSIVRLFRGSRSIRFLSGALLSLCLLSFASVLSPVVGINSVETIPILIVFLGVALDLLRQLFRSVTRLLEPKEAVWRLERETRRALERLHRGFERMADLSWRALPRKKQAEFSKEQYLKKFYLHSPGHDNVLESCATDLTEIAQKAVERADLSSLAFEAISAQRQLGIDSIEIRKTALLYTPVDIMVVKTNAEGQLDRIYENLLAVNRGAIRRGSQSVSRWVIRALGAMAQHMSTVRQEPAYKHFGSIATGPIVYCKMAIRDAMAAEDDDAGYEGADTLSSVSRNSPAGTSLNVHLQTVDGIFQIVRAFLTSPGKGVHVNEPLKRGLEILHILCERKDPALIPALRSFLEELQSLLPVVAVIETGQFAELLHLPLAPAYDNSVASSLPWLIQRSAAFVEKEASSPRD